MINTQKAIEEKTKNKNYDHNAFFTSGYGIIRGAVKPEKSNDKKT
jgi:hypothetical protein